MSDHTRIISAIVLLASLPALHSCVYEDMSGCDGSYYVHLNIRNDWQFAPDASPEGMAYFFYPKSGGKAWRFDLQGKEGGEVRVPDGAYGFIALNDDFRTVVFEDEGSYGDISVTTPACDLFYGACSDALAVGAPPSRGGENAMPLQDVRYSPDMIWSDYAPRVEVAPGWISYTDADGREVRNRSSADRSLTLFSYPKGIVAKYHVRIDNVGNLDGVRLMCGAVSGLAASVRLADGSRSSVPVTVPMRLDVADGNSIAGEFLTFGRADDSDGRNMLGLYVWLNDGKKHLMVFDVTDQVVGSPDPMDVWISLSGVDLPESGLPAGAFDVNVDSWNTIVIDIPG